MTTTLRLRKFKAGDVVAIPVRQGWALARLLTRSRAEFYSTPVERLDSLVQVDVVNLLASRERLYVLAAMKAALSDGRWQLVGTVSGDELPMVDSVDNWKRDAINGRLSIVSTNLVTGEWSEREASHDRCVGLEAAAAWSADHVEDRLSREFDGLENQLPGTVLDPAWRERS